MTLAAIRKKRPVVDRTKMQATTDAQIRRQIEDDADTAPDVTRLGPGKAGSLPPMAPERLIAIRRKTGLSQAAFAGALRIPVGSYRNWEQGRTRPDPVARSLLHLVGRDPKRVLALLAAAE